eukprot:14020731-Alexandrium_andersonii.AAC.1
MSASLVGSEMCIRDRPVSSSPSDSARKTTSNPPDEALWGEVWNQLRGLLWNRAVQVSNTRNRALQ